MTPQTIMMDERKTRGEKSLTQTLVRGWKRDSVSQHLLRNLVHTCCGGDNALSAPRAVETDGKVSRGPL